ncbi:MAG: hypothetical protein QXN55_06615 [Candidatus Nitrosotenuis sp.]
MSRRHTIVLATDLEEKLRKIQSELINTSLKTVSFSEIINQWSGKAWKKETRTEPK